jgi:predicted transposase/invertase (TIGR01784 family)
MKESVIYQEILREGEIKGKVEGKVEGKIEERLAIARNLLNLGLSESLICQATGLSPEALRTLV